MSGAVALMPSSASEPWRQRGQNAQPLLLSKTPVFDIKGHGAILGAGTRYRVLSVNAGIAEVEVETDEGLEIGYCPSVLIGAKAKSGPRFSPQIAVAAAATVILLLAVALFTM